MRLVRENDDSIQTFNTIKKSFLEVEEMEIPLIQYCVMKEANKCFKYLLINGFDDPKKIMKERNPLSFNDSQGNIINIKRYEWDCMTTVIFFGNRVMFCLLVEKDIMIGTNATHIEAAILSYRNMIAKEIIEDF